MRLRTASLALALLAFAAPASAQPWANGDGAHRSHGWRSHAPVVPRPHRTNGRNDCGNGDCRGVNSPGNMGGAPGDF